MAKKKPTYASKSNRAEKSGVGPEDLVFVWTLLGLSAPHGEADVEELAFFGSSLRGAI
jgi:hypothetical protein